MKARQFCSVCKQWLDMEVVPTGDGDEDDGVIWFRCPQCQGFLPKLGGVDARPSAADEAALPESPQDAGDKDDAGGDLPWDSPAAMMAARTAGADETDAVLEAGKRRRATPARRRPVADDDDDDAEDETDDGDLALLDDDDEDAGAADEGAGGGGDPLAEYAALLAAADSAAAAPYRPTGTYEVGQCVHHLAWDDCGVVVAKEALPGGRQVIKCYFAEAGVVRLIVGAPE
ncbi:MAG TPA: hypothetical protein PLQ13_00315 [Candidatus Krumholzibacteria bacterium]|nr:hypothetical protein [Candidatus Krumholzibacteria bacterium]